MIPIQFDEIPLDWRVPGTRVEIAPNRRKAGLYDYPVKAVIVAPKLSTGTATPLVPVEITDTAQGRVLGGPGSWAALMVEAWRRINRTTELWLVTHTDDVAGVAATGSITLSGAASRSFTLSVRIANRRVRIAYSSTMTPTQAAAALVAAIGDDPMMPVTASAAAGVVTLTARHKGEVGNSIDVRLDMPSDQILPGVTCAIVDMAGGTGNASVQPVFDALPNVWFTDAVFAYADGANLAIIAAETEERFNAMTARDMFAWASARGTFGQLGTTGQSVNSPFLSILGIHRARSSAPEIAAAYAARAVFALDQDPSRQLRSLVLTGIGGPDEADLFTEQEQDLLLRRGISTIGLVNDTVTISRAITTYRLSNLGVLDDAWLDVMVPRTVAYIRYDWRSYMDLTYPRSKLVDDETYDRIAGDDPRAQNETSVVCPRVLHASWAFRCALYERRVWIQQADRTIRESEFQLDDSDKNRCNARQIVNLSGNLINMASRLEFETA
jgi:phage tail sheath gpL-like